MNRYYATFIPGLREFIAAVVQERLSDAVICQLLDGAILFETALGYDRLNFFCFNNIFAVIDVMEDIPPLGGSLLAAHAVSVMRDKRLPPAAAEIMTRNAKKFRTFRIVFSEENTPAAMDETLRDKAEQYIARISGLNVNRAKPDSEFWFLSRSEGFSLFMKRLTLRPSWEKSLHPGELPPPLAWTLCRLGNLQSSDTVLDPFCGYGSIPRAALSQFHITRCIACDSNPQAAAYTANRFKNRRDNFVVYTADFRSLPAALPARSIDAIITDPPWGHYRDNARAFTFSFYEEMFNVFDTLLKPDGRLVILGARTGDVPAGIPIGIPDAAKGRFIIQKTIPILLSGKKAAIYLPQ